MPSLVSIRLNLGGLGDSLKLCLSLLLLGRLFLLGFLAWTVFIRILVDDHLTLPLLFFFSLGLSIICLRLLLLLILLLHSRRFKSGGGGRRRRGRRGGRRRGRRGAGGPRAGAGGGRARGRRSGGS